MPCKLSDSPRSIATTEAVNQVSISCANAEELQAALWKVAQQVNDIAAPKITTIELPHDSSFLCRLQCCGETVFPEIPPSCVVRILGNGTCLRRTTGKVSGDTAPLISPSFRYFSVRGRLELVDVQLLGGFSRAACGGAVYVHSGGELVMRKCAIKACAATGRDGFVGSTQFGAGGGEAGMGGALFAEGAKVELDHCLFEGNRAFGGSGGSVLASRGSVMPSSSGHSRGAWTLGRGGDGGNAQVSSEKGGVFGGRGGLVLKETSSAGGGGAALGGAICGIDTDFRLKACMFRDNKCEAGTGGVQAWGHLNGEDGCSVGGAVFAWGAVDKPQIVETNCTFDSNFARLNRDVYSTFTVSEIRLAPRLIMKPCITWTRVADVMFAKFSRVKLPLRLVKVILEDFVDWTVQEQSQ